MTEAERAAALADDLTLWCRDKTDIEDANLILTLLRAHSTCVSTDAELREAGGKAIYEAPGRWKEWEGLDDAMQEAFRRQFDAALSAIHASGWRIVPVEPTEEMINAAFNCPEYAVAPEGRGRMAAIIRAALAAKEPTHDAG